ncbi:hypothetical protein ANO14919_038810 [Xylariales sp. No.14919]|nr:hypothetical protein ANO14919_038810 [Xylariales sp. No.14919]
MPRGWYLAQGFIPLVPSSSDDEEGPCELPDGRIVCGPHGLVSCGRCCSDYSLVGYVPSDSEGDEGKSEDEDGDGEFAAEIREMYQSLSLGERAAVRSRYGSPPPGRNARDQTDSPSPRQAPICFPINPKLVMTLERIQADCMRVASKHKIGTGRVFPTRFPTTRQAPLEIFTVKVNSARVTRYVHRDPRKVLILTDGACLNNGQRNPQAGWAFVHGPGETGVTSGRLEGMGPFGHLTFQTSNRAELRAVIAALGFQAWDAEGFRTIVIATDSEYVARGATAWVKTWIKNGWQKRGGERVKNRDLWEMLLSEVERLHDKGLSVQFWRISRDWNGVADAAAKKAAEQSLGEDIWTDIVTRDVAVSFS